MWKKSWSACYFAAHVIEISFRPLFWLDCQKGSTADGPINASVRHHLRHLMCVCHSGIRTGDADARNTQMSIRLRRQVASTFASLSPDNRRLDTSKRAHWMELCCGCISQHCGFRCQHMHDMKSRLWLGACRGGWAPSSVGHRWGRCSYQRIARELVIDYNG